MPLWLLKAVDALARLFGRELVMTRGVVEVGVENGYRTLAPGRLRYSLPRIERW